MENGELLIYSYLPQRLLPKDIGHLDVDEFLNLCAKALYIRSMRIDDMKAGTLQALDEVLAKIK